jgi:hypothetical protein
MSILIQLCLLYLHQIKIITVCPFKCLTSNDMQTILYSTFQTKLFFVNCILSTIPRPSSCVTCRNTLLSPPWRIVNILSQTQTGWRPFSVARDP